MYADELAELVKEARRPVWTRSTNLRFYFVPFAGAAILTFLPSMEPLRALGVFWMVVIMAVYVLRHRQPSWKYHRRAAGRRPTRPPGGVFRRGI
jgi:hypothetical protein